LIMERGPQAAGPKRIPERRSGRESWR